MKKLFAFLMLMLPIAAVAQLPPILRNSATTNQIPIAGISALDATNAALGVLAAGVDELSVGILNAQTNIATGLSNAFVTMIEDTVRFATPVDFGDDRPSGDGGNFTNLNASAVSGTLNGVIVSNAPFVAADNFIGDGSGLANLNVGAVTIVDTSASEQFASLTGNSATFFYKTNANFDFYVNAGATTNTVAGHNVMVECRPAGSGRWIVKW